MIKINRWTTTDPECWNSGHELILLRNGTLEDDMQEAARWFQCKVTDLKCKAEDITESEWNALAESHE